MASSSSMSESTSTGGWPRKPANNSAPLNPVTIASASAREMGASRSTTSSSTSVRVPPKPEGSHWAERGPVNYPHQQLHPGLRLLFHQETVETPAGLSHCYRHLGRFVVQLEGGHPHTHRVHIALVHHASAEALQHQRLAQPIGRHQISQHRGVGHRVVEGRHHAFGYYYPSIGEQRLDFGLGDDHVIPSE